MHFGKCGTKFDLYRMVHAFPKCGQNLCSIKAANGNLPKAQLEKELKVIGELMTLEGPSGTLRSEWLG